MSDESPGSNNRVEYSYSEMLYLTDHLRGPAIRECIDSMDIREGSRGLEVGCGIGLHTAVLADAVGENGEVVALDISPEMLNETNERMVGSGLHKRVRLALGDLLSLPFASDSFDWVVAVDTIWPGPVSSGCPSESPYLMIRELKRVIRSSGLLALAYWTLHRLLPGYPNFEARLNTSNTVNSPMNDSSNPEVHCMRAAQWLKAEGLENVSGESFVSDVRGPLDRDGRESLAAIFHMLWGSSANELSREDKEKYQDLCLKNSRQFVGNEPEYYGLIIYSMFNGTKA